MLVPSEKLYIGEKAALTTKDIFSIPNSAIIHICNIAGGFGSGFAGQIAEKYPFVRKEYKKLYREEKLHLGMYSKHQKVYNVIINLYAMPDYRRSKEDTACYLDYAALNRSLYNLTQDSALANFLPVVPYGMGAGNAGGDWKRVSDLLDLYLEFYVVCRKDS